MLFFCKQKTAYERRISDWSSDVCSSDLGLVRRYGADRVERACSLSLDLDVVSVNKIASMLERGTEDTAPELPRAVGQQTTRFTRSPCEFNTTTTSLTIVTDQPAAQEI